MNDTDLEALFGIKFPTPSSEGLTMMLPAVGATTISAANSSTLVTSTFNDNTIPSTSSTSEQGANALQLDIADLMTPVGSPSANGFNTPFTYSPTPALSMGPTVASTPAATPRAASRCSSRSSFSATNTTNSEANTPASEGVPATPAVDANGRPRKEHLCPYTDCPRNIRTFRSNADLQRHIRSHRGERPYSCPSPDCNKAYGQQNKMVNHVRQQHPHLLHVVETGRRRRRDPAASTCKAAHPTTPTSTSTPSRVASTPGSAQSSAGSGNGTGPIRVAVTPAINRVAPYNVPNPNPTFPSADARINMNTLRQDVFGSWAA
jgi:hypothetical protein